MDLPRLIIKFDVTSKQFDFESLKINQMPKKVEKLVDTFLEDLNRTKELSFYNRHRLIYFTFFLAFFFILFSAFGKLPIYVIPIVIIILLAVILLIVFKYKMIAVKINKVVKENSASLKRYYTIDCFFRISDSFNLFSKKNKEYRNRIFLENLKKSEFVIFDNYPENHQNITISEETVEEIDKKKHLRTSLKTIIFKKKLKDEEKTQKENKNTKVEKNNVLNFNQEEEEEYKMSDVIKETKSDKRRKKNIFEDKTNSKPYY